MSKTDLEMGFEALRNGEFILVYDDDDREGEVDMIIASEFVTPKSPSILPSITKYSLMELARKYLHMPVYEREVYIDNLDEFKEAGACGTAAVITPIGGIEYKGKLHVFYSETEVGPVIKELYKILYGIQFGDIKAPEGWIYKIN